jgi:hypothetical protein
MFFNTDGMTYDDIKRLNQADPEYTPIKKSKQKFSISADLVWAGACAAQRINNDYIKFESGTTNVDNKISNRTLMIEFIQKPETITDADYEMAKKVRQYFQALTFKVLKGEKLNDFLNNAMLISNRDTITEKYDIAVLASLPNSYIKSKSKDDVNNRIRFAQGGYVGQEYDKVSFTGEVLRSVYSQQWNTYYITCINDQDQVVFFSYKNALDVGTTVSLQGTVKAHRDNSTQLNRVKLV